MATPQPCLMKSTSQSRRPVIACLINLCKTQFKMNKRIFCVSECISKLINHSHTTSFGGKVLKRLAGHSKWANIKHTKALKDHERSVAFQKLSKRISLAVKEGGPNANGNFKLKSLLDEAKKISMPNSTIQNAIKQSTLVSEKPYWLIYGGSQGLLIGFEVISSNPATAIGRINQYAKKVSLKYEKSGANYYTEKGIIISETTNSGNNYEKAVEDAIAIGIDEVTESDDKSLIFECFPTHVEVATRKLQERGYKIQSATTEIEFHNYIEYSDEKYKFIDNAFEKLHSTFEDLIRVVDNVKRLGI